jgi:hypothetical protein
LKTSFLERFRRQCRSAGPSDRAAVFEVLLDLEAALSRPHERRGIGLRKLHSSGTCDVRVGLSLRALFQLSKNEAIFVFFGTHDEARRFLKGLP